MASTLLRASLKRHIHSHTFQLWGDWFLGKIKLYLGQVWIGFCMFFGIIAVFLFNLLVNSFGNKFKGGICAIFILVELNFLFPLSARIFNYSILSEDLKHSPKSNTIFTFIHSKEIPNINKNTIIIDEENSN